MPTDVLGPQARQRRAQVGAEGGGQGVAGQAIDLDARRQEAQRHAHQHRWQGTGGEALHNAQQHQAVQVGGERLQQAKHGEQADGAHGEAAQRKVVASHGAKAMADTEAALYTASSQAPSSAPMPMAPRMSPGKSWSLPR
jgi:hypothetical protein